MGPLVSYHEVVFKYILILKMIIKIAYFKPLKNRVCDTVTLHHI